MFELFSLAEATEPTAEDVATKLLPLQLLDEPLTSDVSLVFSFSEELPGFHLRLHQGSAPVQRAARVPEPPVNTPPLPPPNPDPLSCPASCPPLLLEQDSPPTKTENVIMSRVSVALGAEHLDKASFLLHLLHRRGAASVRSDSFRACAGRLSSLRLHGADWLLPGYL